MTTKLITGVTGSAGSIVIREFARQGVAVRALVRDSERARDSRERLEAMPTVEVVEGDMLRPDTLGKALDGIDRVFMISSPRDRMVETQCTFVDAAKAAGVRHIVKLGGKESGTTFDPQRFRGTRAHLEIEHYLEAQGVAWTHLRPSQFMEFYLPGALTGVDAARRVLAMPIGDSRLAPVAIEDIAKVAVAMLQAEQAGQVEGTAQTGQAGSIAGRAYDMTGPEALTPAEIVERISEATGTPYRYERVTREEKRALHTAQGLPQEVVDLLDELYTERAASPESRVDLGAHEAFGVRPTAFATFAGRNSAAFQG